MKNQLFLVRRRENEYSEHETLDAAVSEARGLALSTGNEISVYRATAVRKARRQVTVDELAENPSNNPNQ